mmetsp:Transcript_36082/g.83740  ORF Transcript_36082/g.83740 Transcript_36082/m.83740 type:complete len:273 (-) Transcript_36082:216-1034(-)
MHDASGFDVHVDESRLDQGRRGTNFLVLKLKFLDMNVSAKIYTSRYVQLFGFKDTVIEAEDAALFLLDLLLRVINMVAPDPFQAPAELDVMARSAFHIGVSELGMCFDLSVIEALLREVAATSQPSMEVNRNARNGSVIVRHAGEGSQIFHSTGTLQLMGVRGRPAHFLEATRQLLLNHPEALIHATRKRKKRANMLTGTCNVATPVPPTPCLVLQQPPKRSRAELELDTMLQDALDDPDNLNELLEAVTTLPLVASLDTRHDLPSPLHLDK